MTDGRLRAAAEREIIDRRRYKLGVDFAAILDHGLTWDDLCRLPTTLSSRWTTPSSLAAFLAGYPNAGTEWHWRLSPGFSSAAEELFDEGYVNLEGPGGFGAWVHKRALEVTNLARWWSFLHDQDVRAGLLDGVRGLARILRSSTIIYLPDSALPPSVASDQLLEGNGVAEVIGWLQNNVGGPAPSIDAICGPDEDHPDEAGYLVERAT
jgi:hypothetical protein